MPKSKSAQILAKQLHQSGGAFLLNYLRFCDAGALTAMSEKVKRNPESALDALICKRFTLELLKELPPAERWQILPIVPQPILNELREHPLLRPKTAKEKPLLIHQPKSRPSLWRSLLGA